METDIVCKAYFSATFCFYYIRQRFQSEILLMDILKEHFLLNIKMKVHI